MNVVESRPEEQKLVEKQIKAQQLLLMVERLGVHILLAM